MAAIWRGIEQSIRDRISNGHYHDELPSEAELMTEYGVSRTPVRRALLELVNEGLIESNQGSPYRIRTARRWRWPMHEWESRHRPDADAWAVSIREQGGEPTEEVTVTVEQAPTRVAAALDLEPGSAVVVRRRVRSVDGLPHQLADSYIPYAIAEAHPIFLAPGYQYAPGGLLAASGLPQARLDDVIDARMPTPDERRALRMLPGTPLIVQHRTGYTADGRPVRHMVTSMAADRVEVGYQLQWGPPPESAPGE